MSPKHQRRVAKLAAEAEAMGMTLAEARVWWPLQRELKYGFIPVTGREAVRWRTDAPKREAAARRRQEVREGMHGDFQQHMLLTIEAAARTFRENLERQILFGDGDEP